MDLNVDRHIFNRILLLLTSNILRIKLARFLLLALAAVPTKRITASGEIPTLKIDPPGVRNGRIKVNSYCSCNTTLQRLKVPPVAPPAAASQPGGFIPEDQWAMTFNNYKEMDVLKMETCGRCNER